MSHVTVKNGKEYLMGDPRAYLVIFKKHGVMLGMNTLGGLKFRMDFPNLGDSDEGEDVMAKEVSAIVEELRYFFPKARHDHMTTGTMTESDPEQTLEFIHKAANLMTPTMDVGEIEAGVKAVSQSITRAQEVVKGVDKELPPEAQALKKEYDELREQYLEIQQKLMKMQESLQEHQQTIATKSKDLVEADDQMQAFDMAMATFRATTDQYTADQFAEAEKTCLYVSDEEA